MINYQIESGCRRRNKQKLNPTLTTTRAIYVTKGRRKRKRQVREDRATCGGGGFVTVCVIGGSLRRLPTASHSFPLPQTSTPRDVSCSCPARIHLLLFRVLLPSSFASQRTHTRAIYCLTMPVLVSPTAGRPSFLSFRLRSRSSLQCLARRSVFAPSSAGSYPYFSWVPG